MQIAVAAVAVLVRRMRFSPPSAGHLHKKMHPRTPWHCCSTARVYINMRADWRSISSIEYICITKRRHGTAQAKRI